MQETEGDRGAGRGQGSCCSLTPAAGGIGSEGSGRDRVVASARGAYSVRRAGAGGLEEVGGAPGGGGGGFGQRGAGARVRDAARVRQGVRHVAGHGLDVAAGVRGQRGASAACGTVGLEAVGERERKCAACGHGCVDRREHNNGTITTKAGI